MSWCEMVLDIAIRLPPDRMQSAAPAYHSLPSSFKHRRREHSGICQSWTGVQSCTNELEGGSHVTAKRGETGAHHEGSSLPLSAREVECLEWLGRGLRVGGIGSKLGIASTTVVTHLTSARKKLRAVTREEALVLALRHGLIKP